MNTEIARFNMIEQQIRPWEVLDARVLRLLGEIRREDFVPSAHRALAFADMELPLTHPAVDGQVMLPPRVEARLLQDLDIQPTDKVLEVGAGSGHMAPLLASLAQRVVSLEIDDGLARTARANLQRAGITNADVRQIDAAAAPQVDAPFDVVVDSSSSATPPTGRATATVSGRMPSSTPPVPPPPSASPSTSSGPPGDRYPSPQISSRKSIWDLSYRSSDMFAFPSSPLTGPSARSFAAPRAARCQARGGGWRQG